MIQPLQPWPRPSSHDDMLSELVASGDISRVRDYFDSVFWENRKERPDWTHMRIALLREDRPMLRLLHTWGAKPTDAQLAAFKAAARDKYPDYMKLLRSAGFRREDAWWEEDTSDPLKPSRDDIAKRAHEIFIASGSKPGRDTDNWLQAERELTEKLKAAALKQAEADEALMSDISYEKSKTQLAEKLPQEWKLVVQAFQTAGANEAIIAGGALRDTYNNRPVKDVDIFLRSRGSQKKNRKLLEGVFDALGLEVTGQVVGYDYGSEIRKKFPEPKLSRDKRDAPRDDGLPQDIEMESWKVVAGPSRTEYNIVFVDDKRERVLAEQGRSFEQRAIFTGTLLNSFDIGLCQIACDGETVVSTAAYRDDVKYQRVSLLRPNMTTEDHLQRVVTKYAGWQLNAEAQKALAPKPAAPKPRSSGYSWHS